jgi:hypothetical protein
MAKYRAWLPTQPDLIARLPELKEKILGVLVCAEGADIVPWLSMPAAAGSRFHSLSRARRRWAGRPCGILAQRASRASWTSRAHQPD